MHDVLDPRDIIPDEAEQLAHSGYAVGDLEQQSREAAAASDLPRLAAIGQALAGLQRDPDWAYEEPGDEAVLLELAGRVEKSAYEPAELPGRIRGAWLGRAVGNTMGKPIEGLTRGEVETYLRAAGQWPQTGFVRLLDPLPAGVDRLHPSAATASEGNFTDVPRDDDIDWTILGLNLLETHGRGLTTEHIAAEWLGRLPFTQIYTAERAAYRNLIAGLRAPATATEANPYREWIGALIRGDIFGYVNPGDPAEAARLALVDARLSHTANGAYGEMWAAALLAAAFTTDSAREALGTALRVVPGRSRLAEALRGALELFDGGASSEEALDWVDETLGHYSWVHTIHNAALISIGLLWGRDFAGAVAIAISGGRDTDSTAATVGSAYGALHGDQAVPAELVGTTHEHVRSDVRGYDHITIDELAERTLRLVPGGAG